MKSASDFGGTAGDLGVLIALTADLRFFSWYGQEHKHWQIGKAIMMKHISKENYSHLSTDNQKNT